MTIFPITKAAPGLTLAEDIVSPQGMKIASKGDTITNKHLKAFKAWGVTEITVLGEDELEQSPAGSANAAPVPSEESTRKIELMFSKANRDDPVMAKLFELALNRASNP